MLYSWISTIHEKAVTENINLKSAEALTHVCRDYKTVMGLQEGIKQTERQLNLLREFNIEKERAIITLMNLQMAGITEKQIVQLV